ncbi:MAG: hypothetical protein JO246_13300 [Frankiaceae bacterium]|nr:hypothetical protein [Frankiaceae bacterium]MBV9872638.1 hypothetical protein [Frankiaceae bacterium]
MLPWHNGRFGALITTFALDGLLGIDCPTSSGCIAVGTNAGYGGIAMLDPTGKIVATTDTRPYPAEFDGVACWTPRRCLAVGDAFHGNTIATLLINGKPQTPVRVKRHSQLDKIACGGHGLCIASGDTYKGRGIVAEFRRGQLRRVRTIKQFLYGAACPTPSTCILGGATSPARGATGIFRVVKRGRLKKPIAVLHTNGVGDTSCPTPTRCVSSSGTGKRGEILTLAHH